MNPILELPEVRSRAVPLSVATYEWMTAKDLVARQTELIQGIIVEKMSKPPLHSYLSKTLFARVLKCAPRGFHVQREDPLTLAGSEPEPDIAVVPGKVSDYSLHHPTTARLVIEVSVTSERLDQQKANIYAEAGVGEYWIVLGHRRTIEVYRLPEAGRYKERRTWRTGEVLKSSALPSLEIDLAALFPGKR